MPDPTSDLVLGLPGFRYPDLHDAARLSDLLAAFDQDLCSTDPELAKRYLAARSARGAGLSPVERSELLVAVAPHLSRFLGRLFGIEAGLQALRARAREEDAVMRFRREFLQRRVFHRYKPGALAGHFAALDARVRPLVAVLAPDASGDEELATARAVLLAFDLGRELGEALARGDAGAAPLARWSEIARAIAARPEALAALPEAGGEGASAAQAALAALVDLFERWAAARRDDPGQSRDLARWVSYRRPEPVDHEHLVQVRRPSERLPELAEGPPEHRRRRDGFRLTDRRMSPREVRAEIHYCIYCHERDKDSCAKGLFEARGGPVRKNPLGIELAGCPLEEKISEAHSLARDGDLLAALAVIVIDNPMCPGTGHRICNDCMKACIYQKQEPVNIPQIETGILTDVLGLRWGFEVWSLLTRWNPLALERPVARPANGRNVLVVGLGPAGYTLAHYLANEGFGVVGIDGLKIEPLPEDLVGAPGRAPRPLEWVGELNRELDRRVLAGFGGVSEYGITVRWDKNFLTLLHLNLARRANVRLYGGVRFGGTLDIDQAWALGFDHIAIAAGAGKPTTSGMRNDLIRGVRTASDFLMALQLTGAFKRDALANLQVQLPAVVIGGGLTAIDTATELMAYYPLQVEKTLERFEALAAELGAERVLQGYDEEDRHILETFLAHGREVRAERARARAAGEEPDLARLVREWGGVTIAYRKRLLDAPSYRLNHEEVVKALEEGIRFAERLSPVEAIPDRFGAVSAIRFERMSLVDGKWRGSGQFVELPARSVCVAAGTSPNVIYEREHPGTFTLDRWDEFFLGHRLTRRKGRFELEAVAPDSAEVGFFTSYHKDGRFITYYGDNHPVFAGNVVKAMASAKHGFPQVVRLFEEELAQLDPDQAPDRARRFEELGRRLDDLLVPTVAEVNRLTPTIVELVVRAPLAARRFHPGQFYRLQNYETTARVVDGTRLLLEGIALTGAWVDPARGLLSLIVLEMGTSSRLVSSLRPGERVVVMGPTGAPTEIPRGETVLLAGGGLGNAVLFSIARALREAGNRVLYFAGYRRKEDLFKRAEIEAATDEIVWSVDAGDTIEPQRPQDHTFRGNIVQAMLAHAEGRLGPTVADLKAVDRIIAIGSDRMMAAVKQARHQVLAPYLKPGHVGIGSINSLMQCMMKEVCGQCLQKHVDPATGRESFVFSCFNQDQHLDEVDFKHLNERLKMNSVLEKLSNLWLDRTLARAAVARV